MLRIQPGGRDHKTLEAPLLYWLQRASNIPRAPLTTHCTAVHSGASLPLPSPPLPSPGLLVVTDTGLYHNNTTKWTIRSVYSIVFSLPNISDNGRCLGPQTDQPTASGGRHNSPQLPTTYYWRWPRFRNLYYPEGTDSFISEIPIAEDVCEVGLESSEPLHIVTVIHHPLLTSPAQVCWQDPASTGEQNGLLLCAKCWTSKTSNNTNLK